MSGLWKAEFSGLVKMNVLRLFPFYFIAGSFFLIFNMATHCSTDESLGHSFCEGNFAPYSWQYGINIETNQQESSMNF